MTTAVSGMERRLLVERGSMRTTAVSGMARSTIEEARPHPRENDMIRSGSLMAIDLCNSKQEVVFTLRCKVTYC